MQTKKRTEYCMPSWLRALGLACVLSIAIGWPGQVLTEPVAAAVTSSDKRFIDNGDGTITDTRTGLMWMKKDSYLHAGHWIDWFQAFDYVKKLNEERFADYIDWKLPSIEQLQTLFEPDKFNSAQRGSEMNMHMDPIFAKEGSGSLWAAEANGRYNAFGVVFNTGDRFSSSKKSKARRAVRAVRETGP